MARQENGNHAPEKELKSECSIADEALEWFLRLRDTTPDQATQNDFDQWLSISPAHAQEFRDIENMWDSPVFGQAVESLPVAHAMRSRRTAATFLWGNRAAMAIAAAVIAIALWQYPVLLLRWQADYLTAVGGSSSVTLPDGSLMMLSTASAAAIDFSEGKRKVHLLRGEAFFDVRKDTAHPFHVLASHGEIEVLGTAFSVRSDNDNDRVILERGRVQVSRVSDRTDKAYLQPGEMILAGKNALSGLSRTDPSAALAWREGRVIFESQTFSHVLDELRRYYVGTVMVVGESRDKLLVTGNYRLDNIEVAIRTLADSVGASMVRLPGGLIILR